MSAHASPAKVAILLCTWNGEPFLQEQLDSYTAQGHGNWRAWASDDGSTDATLAILERQRQRWGGERLALVDGPGKGGPENFMSLVCREEIQADYYAFSDQDDIWYPDKLARAIAWLEAQPADQPALYCGRTSLIDERGQPLGLSPLYARPPGFANALVQNIGGGNTMVFNAAARRLICSLGPEIAVVVHDWWAYQIVTGCGGRVFFDRKPSVQYRQHESNLIGHDPRWHAGLLKGWNSLMGQHREWYDIQLTALARVESKLTPHNQAIFRRFSQARTRWLVPRLLGILRSGVTRQTQVQNIALVLSSILNKV